MKVAIPLFEVFWDQTDLDAINEVITRGGYWADGPEIYKFEGKIAEYLGRKYCVTFNSGTSALHSILLAYNIKDSEVIVPSFTFISTANSVILAGAKPVFAETEEQTFGLDARSVEKNISNKTKAIIPIHYGGQICRDIEQLKDIAEKNNLLLIEDAAESIGATFNGKKAGAFGNAAMLSFCQNKVITTGEGGAIVTDDSTIYEKLKLIRSHGRIESKNNEYFNSINDLDYVDIGYNFRMPTMNAALGISQLIKIEKIISLRRQKAAHYNKGLSNLEEIIPPTEKNHQKHVYQLYTILIKSRKLRGVIQKALKKEGIMSKIYFNPIHLKSYYRLFGNAEGDLPFTEELSKKVLTLPLYPSLTTDQQDSIIKIIKENCR